MPDWRAFKVSIRTRIMVLVLIIIAVTFAAILGVFNVLVNEYIRNSVHEQLQGATETAGAGEKSQAPPNDQPPPGADAGAAPNIRKPPRGRVGQAETIVVSADYTLIFPDAGMAFLPNYDESKNLAAQLATDQIDLRSAEVVRLDTGEREYYCVSIATTTGNSAGQEFVIYYVDMTTIASFAARINIVLLIVMGIVGGLAAVSVAFLADRIARPIRELTQVAARIGEGDFSRSSADYRDIELANLASSMNRSAGQLEAYDKEQKTFFQNVSHELRTPLQVIKCNAEGIEHGILDVVKASRVILTETDRLSEMVEDLLYLSRVDNITKSSRWAECDLRELLSNAAERQRGLAAQRGIQFEIDFDDEPANLLCDEKSINRAFSNLMSNAIRYARARITLACHVADQGIRVSVADDGPGISAEDLPHVFDRFYHGAGGLHGIGLSIVKAVVKQHQGSIEARNTETGTVFTIIF